MGDQAGKMCEFALSESRPCSCSAGRAVRSVVPDLSPSLAIPSISVEVNLVVLPATVSVRVGGFVSGLEIEDFMVFVNGRAQAIRLFHGEDVPVSVGLLVDNSASMGAKRNDVAAAAVAFAGSSNPLDEMFVIDFNEEVTLGLRQARNSFRPKLVRTRSRPQGRSCARTYGRVRCDRGRSCTSQEGQPR